MNQETDLRAAKCITDVTLFSLIIFIKFLVSLISHS